MDVCIFKTRENGIVKCLDYQIPVTQRHSFGRFLDGLWALKWARQTFFGAIDRY